MKLIQAQEEDQERLNSFFSNSLLPGPIDIQFSRENFFAPYHIQSDDFATYILVNEKDQIEAMASLVFCQAYLEGERQIIGFAKDLRVANSRKATLSWPQYFLPTLEAEKKKRNCQLVFSVVAQGQRKAYNTLIRPRSLKRQMPRYHQYQRLKVITVHGHLPFSPPPIRSLELRQGQASELDALINYILKKRRELNFSYSRQISELKASLERWPHLDMENFILALDSQQNIVGCTGLWKPNTVQNLKINQYHGRAKTLQESLQILSWFGKAHPLPKAGGSLDLVYMTHLYADNPDIFYGLLKNAYERLTKYESLVYVNFERDRLTRPPRSLITSEIQAALYCLLSPHEEIPEILDRKSVV